MDNSDTLFGRKDTVARPRKITTSAPKKVRKQRIDKKHDIKIQLSAADKVLLKQEARKHNLKLTPFLEMLVKQELSKSHQYDNSFFYDRSGSFVHVKLAGVFFEMIQSMSDEMDLTYREVVHRIIKTYIQRISGIKINSWGGRP
ncbi:hypothetical protein [Niallia sp. NCCP-28]|uniref:hypothetical protein n=1 Tax=Niallia sp. NCCP-28 TaxID=2934712 RepID=UPI00207FF2D9|nr:hypothetical protein [Niallia sp. NCCP-28]GKU82585.1 hypothetical protein NCCP28_19810 [Niallia sp. NCCP-28]